MSNVILALLVLLGMGGGSNTGKSQIRQVDLMELNHFLDHEGREVFRQVIFYDWAPATKQFHVRQWRLIRSDDELPRQNVQPKGVRCDWLEKGIARGVLANDFRETWSQKDPEQTNRRILPEDQRRPLFE